jgi:hypothetical protein
MKLAFTICSNNYLAHAKTLGDSLLEHNPEYHFVIVLVDRRSPALDYNFLSAHEILLIEDIGIEDFEKIWQKYNIIELNTCAKPSVFKYFFQQYPNIETGFYFDPDIVIYHSLEKLESYFADGDILLTPHALSPVETGRPAGLVPSDSTFLNHGLYNLGFIGLKNKSSNVESFLNWWEKRTLSAGFIDVCNGLFVDQLWINLAPVYFEKVEILREMGYNMAPWNLHERGRIQEREGIYILPDHSILTFYHFSSYKYTSPSLMASYYNLFQFSDFPEILPLYSQYQELLLSNKIDLFSRESCYFVEIRKKYLQAAEKEDRKKDQGRRKLKELLKAFTPPVIWRAFKKTVN